MLTNSTPVITTGPVPTTTNTPDTPTTSASKPVEERSLVLVVESDRIVASLLRDFLERAGYAVVHFPDAHKARSFVRRNAAPSRSPSILIGDVLMPGAAALVRDLQRANPAQQPRVLCLRGSSSDEDVDRARAAGADAYVAKPFSPTTLVDRVHNLLDTPA